LEGFVIIEDNKKDRIYRFHGFKLFNTDNWHVFKDKEMAESEVHFFYEYNIQGQLTTPVLFRFDT